MPCGQVPGPGAGDPIVSSCREYTVVCTVQYLLLVRNSHVHRITLRAVGSQSCNFSIPPGVNFYPAGTGTFQFQLSPPSLTTDMDSKKQLFLWWRATVPVVRKFHPEVGVLFLVAPRTSSCFMDEAASAAAAVPMVIDDEKPDGMQVESTIGTLPLAEVLQPVSANGGEPRSHPAQSRSPFSPRGERSSHDILPGFDGLGWGRHRRW